MLKARSSCPVFALSLWSLVACAALPGCEADLGQRVGQAAPSFGAILYREVCQRVTYSADLSAAMATGSSSNLDVSGNGRRALCQGLVEPAPSDAADVRALAAQRAHLVAAVDTTLPEPLLDSFDAYLQALSPLMDDGTVSTLLGRSGELALTLQKDAEAAAGLGRLGRWSGMRPASTEGGLLRSLASAPALDEVSGTTLALMVPGGAAHDDLSALLSALAFEARHLDSDRDSDPASPERTPALLRDLLLSRHDELKQGKPLQIAMRDHRGLPILADVKPPYVKDESGLARADDLGRFIDEAGRPITPQIPPLAPVGQADPAAGMRDEEGRALDKATGKPLYRYADLDGALISSMLLDAQRLFSDKPARPRDGAAPDIVLGMTEALRLIAGSRKPAQKEKGGERIEYSGLSAQDSVLLDLLHGALPILRLRSDGTAAAEELTAIVAALQGLMGDPKNEGPLARSLQALLDAADEAKRPDHDGAKLPRASTLYDDLAPLLARIMAVPDRMEAGKPVSLLEDLVTALGDPHGKALGHMTAQLLSERGYFFMRQPSTMDDLDNGLSPTGVVGSFGHPVGRAAPDSDATQDWRGQKVSDPANNRSVMARLLHTLADTNGGRPFCNGRNASLFGGFIVFGKQCDLFQVDNIARFFLLSIASRPVREDAGTFARQSASFLEAIKNGRDCRCVPGDPMNPCEDSEAKRKCMALLTNIPDGDRGDLVLSGMMGIKGFGRFPEPAAAGRSLFMDLGDATSKPMYTPIQPKDLLFNHIANMDGTLPVDAADPDNRKFIDGAGQARSFVDEHNGVLFALEAVRGPSTYPDGTRNPYPDDTFYDAMRPLVDAFGRHFECFKWSADGKSCLEGQNATQILADAMTVLHRHWPSAASQVFGRGFSASYGPAVSPDGAVSYEVLAAKVMGGDLLPSTAALSPILAGLTGNGKPALPLLMRLMRLVFDPKMAPAGLALRNGSTQALRNDGKPAYADATLAKVSGAAQDGKLTPFYLIAEGVIGARKIFDQPQNRAAKTRFDQALSDAIDALLLTRREMNGPYRFDNPRIRATSVLLLDFLSRRLTAHKDELATGAWGDKIEVDARDALTGPLLPGLLDLGVKLDAGEPARAATYALLRQVLGGSPETLAAMAVAGLDGVQLLLDDGDLIPIARSLASALDLRTGPIDPALLLMKRGRELEQGAAKITVRPLLPTLLRNLMAQNPDGTYPLWRIGDAVAEVNREQPGAGGPLTGPDYQALLGQLGRFLTDEQRGMPRFISIVKGRCDGPCAPAQP